MERNRRTFLIALAIYGLWVIGLGVLSWTSGARPIDRAAAPVVR
jgi:hypothetical protein